MDIFRGDTLNVEDFVNSSRPKRNAENHIRIDATFEGLRIIDGPIDTFVEDAGVDDASIAYNVKLAVHEICTNIVEHAYQFAQNEQIDVWMHFQERPAACLTVTLRDSGRPFRNRPDAPSEPSSLLDDHGEGGYGLFLANALMDDVEYRHIDGHNEWRLKKNILSS